MTRPQTPEEWEAAVREEARLLRSLGWCYEAIPSPPEAPHRFEEIARGVYEHADRLAALLPPAKERVPWWEAKGRTVDGREITEVSDGHRGSVWTPSVWAETSILGGRRFLADADGMVEVDAL